LGFGFTTKGGPAVGNWQVSVLKQGDQGDNLIPPSLILIPDIPDIPEVPWVPSGA
jgi:hypothetical protein